MTSDFFAASGEIARAVKPIPELFAQDAMRHEWLTIEGCGIYADFTRQKVDRPLMDVLFEFVAECGVAEKRDAMFSGKQMNATENRQVLHVALRGSGSSEREKELARLQRVRAQQIAESIRRNSNIDVVINIGIGGSDLGPQMAVRALHRFCDGPEIRFVSNIDAADLDTSLRDCDPQRTLVIVSSKTFTTLETMHNALRARQWMTAHGVEWTQHFYASTADRDAACSWGVESDHCVEFFDWVGGRFSVSSVIGLPLMIAIGPRAFEEFLAGMQEMDQHFLVAPLKRNLPVMHGALWFLNAAVHCYPTVAVVPYSHDLARLPAFLQQLVMESNGKGVTEDGQSLSWSSSPVVWGEPGTNSQHAFFQMIHQGTQVVPVEFISTVAPLGSDATAHELLLANMFAQSEALAQGSVANSSYRSFPGDRPSSVLMLDELTPRRLGALISMYEHSVAVQGWLMKINSFDQFGVELGKVLATSLATTLRENKPDPQRRSIHHLVKWYLENKTS